MSPRLIADPSTPVVVLNCKLGGLGIMRSLGPQGVFMAGVDESARSPGMVSRYCRERVVAKFDRAAPDIYLDRIMTLGRRLGGRPVLIPTSDDLAVFVAENRETLRQQFVFPDNDPALVRALVSKRGMYRIAQEVGVPVAQTEFPRSLEEVEAFAERTTYPVMLKGIHGDRLFARTGKKMLIVRDRDELMEHYRLMEDPEQPNLMLQEYIPGGDDQVYIFNGYFDNDSECQGAFTGHKIRQYPIHVGCASLGICKWNAEVAALTQDFMQRIGYRGILDIGYRLDPRDGRYKVLDVNPRVGQAFRLFTAENDMDVVRALYLDLTGQERMEMTPREGRRWWIEDYDLISTVHYLREGSLTIREWLGSFGGVEEGAWFHWRDWRPFLHMVGGLLVRSGRHILQRSGLLRAPRSAEAAG